MPKRLIDLTGERFGMLTVIKRVDNDKNGQARWLCKCDCGNEKVILGGSLTRKNRATTHCGCIPKNYKHGMRNTRLYRIFSGMKSRCYNINEPHYDDYGGRGIKVCDEWLDDFMNFYNWAMDHGYSDDLTIDRIDVNGNYEPSNCRWVTMREQQSNKRNIHLISYNCEEHTLIEWCQILNLPFSTINKRIKANWNIKEAFETPIDITKRGH